MYNSSTLQKAHRKHASLARNYVIQCKGTQKIGIFRPTITKFNIFYELRSTLPLGTLMPFCHFGGWNFYQSFLAF